MSTSLEIARRGESVVPPIRRFRPANFAPDRTA